LKTNKTEEITPDNGSEILTTSEGFTFRKGHIKFENQNKLCKEKLEEFVKGLEEILNYANKQ